VEPEIYIKRVAEETGISREALLKEVNRVQGVASQQGSRDEISKIVRSTQVNSALEDAKSGLLSIVASDKALYDRVERVFDKKEFADALYARLYEIIGEMHARNKPVYEADIVTFLNDEPEEVQSRAVRIFMAQLPYDTDEQRYRALADDLKMIKTDYIDQLLDKADDEQFMQLVRQKKNVDNIIKSL
jgi:replicative DNA helicase